MLLGIDIGTTHLKVGLFNSAGELVHVSVRPMELRENAEGYAYYDPQSVFDGVIGLLIEVCSQSTESIQAIGVASMAETGMLVNQKSGKPITPFLPWFEHFAGQQAQGLIETWQIPGAIVRRGIRPSYKCSLAKLIWLKENHPDFIGGSCWLSTADAICYLLTAEMATDPTLAQRTAAFRIDNCNWDVELLNQVGLPPEIFPKINPHLDPVGNVHADDIRLQFLAGVPVWNAGHDHVAGAFCVQMLDGCDSEDFIFDSIGTAESLLGVFPVKTLGPQQANSMFAFGPYPYSDALYWMGGISASGGSIDWLRKIMGDPALSYDQLDQLITDQTERPGQIRFFPYLAGSGSPNSNPEIRGVIWGLDAKHRRNDLYLGVLEGIAFEAELIREHAQGKLGIEGNKIYIAGGGIKNQRWMQIKADIFGCPVLVIEQAETTLLGAALYAGLGAGVFQDRQDLSKRLNKKVVQYYYPSPSHAEKYRTIFEIEYKGLHAYMMRKIEKIAHSQFEE